MSAHRQAAVTAAVLGALASTMATGCRRRSPPSDLVFVSNEDSGDVSVIDGATDVVVATIPVGKRPRGLRVSQDGTRLFIAVTGSAKGGPGSADKGVADTGDARRDAAADGIAVVDVASRRVVGMLGSGRDPETFDVTSDARSIWVSNEETSEVSVLDVPANRIVGSVKVGAEPEGVTLSPSGQDVYVTSEAASEVTVIRVASREVTARIPTASRPRAVVFTPDGTKALVTAELGGTLDVIDTGTVAEIGRIRTGGPGAKPMGVAVTTDGVHAFVANGREGSVGIIDLPSRRLEGTVREVGTRPWGVGLASGEDKLYVAAGPDVAVVDVLTKRVVKRIPVGKGPWGIAVARKSP